jgi:lysophospholipase L1-like esterase
VPKLALCVILAILICAVAGAASARAAGVYVALGDSYTSAPLVPNQHGDPIDCGRSDHNYPSLVAAALGVDTFVDVSCGSAQTKHMTEPQTGLPLGGTNPPQFNALRADATLVTVGIGGNDAGLVGVAEKCAQLGLTNPAGTACRNYWAPGGNDTVAAKIEAAKPKIAAVLQGIHQRSPSARVAIVGYPDVLPKNGESCYPMVPLSPDDIRYIDELIVRINAMIAGQAAANDAEFIDTYADSGGHDVCKLPPNRWFEGLVPTEPAYPLHPNGKGEASMGRSAIAVLSRPRGETGGTGGPGGAGGTGGSGGNGPGAGARRCLARRPTVGRRGIGPIKLGSSRARLVRRVSVRPARRTRDTFTYCAKGGAGVVVAVFSKRGRRGRVEFVLSTAPSAAFTRDYPARRRLGRGLFLASPRSRRLLAVSGHRVWFVAVAGDGALRNVRRLNRDLRLALR